MDDMMTFLASVEEFMEQYKMTDTEHVYSNGTEYVPIYRMKQWFEHCRDQHGPAIDAVSVVRCRECKYRFGNNGHSKNGCPIIDANIWMDDDDFCSYGERK